MRVKVLAFLALLPGVQEEVASPAGSEGHLVAALELAQARVWQGREAIVRLTLENQGGAPESLFGAALFGDGLVLTRQESARAADGAERGGGEARTWRILAAPEAAKGPILLPPAARVSTLVDLGRLAPEAFLEPGCVTVSFEGNATCQPFEIDVWQDYSRLHVVIETDLGSLRLGFFPDQAPRTVKNFFDLVQSGFYDELTFHRVVKGFMIQGGCPVGDGTGSSGTRIPFEPSDLRHDRGTLSMARQADLDSASCQFFICQERKPFLDGNYTVFGRLVDGFDTLDRIAEVECVWAVGGPDSVPSRPKERVFLRKLRIVEATEEDAE